MDGKLVVARRTTARYETEQAVHDAYATMHREFERIGRADKRLLIDLRLATGRNDASSEAALAKHRRAHADGFERAAVLVGTVAGRMQVERLMREDGLDLRVFNEERPARLYLTR